MTGKRTSDLMELQLLYGLARSLHRGVGKDSNPKGVSADLNHVKTSECRPGLPREIVLVILRLAACIHPSPSPEYSVNSTQSIYASGRWQSGEKLHWFKTSPLTSKSLFHLATMQLMTNSKDQGIWNRGTHSRSFFTIDILDLFGQPKRRPDGCELTWRSHENSAAAQDFRDHFGRYFDWDHEIWDNLQVGDSLVVTCCAYYPDWENHAESGRLMMWNWFEPSFW